MFDVRDGARAAISRLTIRSGNPSDDSGGAARNFGTLELSAVSLTGNTASNGGGVRNSGSLTVTGSTLSGNRANEGGGIRTTGRLTVTDSTISNNVAGSSSVQGYGGGIDIDPGAVVSISNSSITANTSSYKGGGIEVGGSLSLVNTRVEGNTPDDCSPGPCP